MHEFWDDGMFMETTSDISFCQKAWRLVGFYWWTDA
jgi:hypothetical protein